MKFMSTWTILPGSVQAAVRTASEIESGCDGHSCGRLDIRHGQSNVLWSRQANRAWSLTDTARTMIRPVQFL